MINIDRIVILTLDKRLYENKYPYLTWKAKSKFGSVSINHISKHVCGKGKYETEYNPIDPDDEDIPDSWKNGPFGKLTNSYCAFLCFQNIIRKAKKQNIERLLILEDDFEFTENFHEIYNKASEQLEDLPPWDMLYFGANHTWSPTKQWSNNILKLYGSLCWHSVLLKNTVFDEILSWTPTMPIDTMAAKVLHPKYTCLAIWPSIMVQKPGYSNVEGKERDYSEFWSCKGNPAL
jgi:hypothetical protein